MDIVYVVGSGSKWDNNELKYSLRSLENFPHKNVIIVGVLPEWAKNIIHIDVQDNFADINGGKYRNVVRKIRAACQDERISDEFVLMNDDFFFLEPVEKIEPYTNGTIQSLIDYYEDPRHQYSNALIRTNKLLLERGIEKPMSYAIHYPIVYDKKKFLQMTDDMDWLEKGYSWRSLYGNLFKIGDVGRNDPKINSALTFMTFLNKKYQGDFLSISNNVALFPPFQKWIDERFPNKSNYEL